MVEFSVSKKQILGPQCQDENFKTTHLFPLTCPETSPSPCSKDAIHASGPQARSLFQLLSNISFYCSLDQWYHARRCSVFSEQRQVGCTSRSLLK